MAVPILPVQVVNEMAKREHRIMHYLWHGVRNSWERLTPAQKQEIRNIDPAWESPRPALDRRGNVIRNNDSGEDFLYMHREMIKFVNGILAQVGDPNYPKIEGWKVVPAPRDLDYPVVPMPGLESIKSDDFYNRTMLPQEQRYKSTDYLKGVTLGQLGADIEFTIHNNMHMRWAAPSSVGYRPSTPIAQPVDTSWDNPAYNYLGDTYSSHVNPIFWKLHGWVDNRIEDWKKANGVTGEIKWKGTWVGPTHHDPHSHKIETFRIRDTGDLAELAKMERVTKILADAAVFDGFFRPEREKGVFEKFIDKLLGFLPW